MMDAQQALKIVDHACRVASLSRDAHDQVKLAIQVLARALAPEIKEENE